MKVTVIISTYNHPKWLHKTLLGYAQQTDREFDVAIADDGSAEPTTQVIEEFQASHPHLSIQRYWHEDRGYQRQTILNTVLQDLDTDYIIMTDGDCIPRADFVAIHRKHAQQGYFLSGGYCKLPLELSRLISPQDIKDQTAFNAHWLRANGLKKLSPSLKLSFGPQLAEYADRLTPTKPTWNNCNSSGYLEDLLAINGYNEDFKYGGSDRELGERLSNLGLKAKQLRHRAIVVHLDHKRGYKNEEEMKQNLAIRERVKAQGITQCANGIKKLQGDNLS